MPQHVVVSSSQPHHTCSSASMTLSRSSTGTCTAYSPMIHAVAEWMGSLLSRLPDELTEPVNSGSWQVQTDIHMRQGKGQQVPLARSPRPLYSNQRGYTPGS